MRCFPKFVTICITGVLVLLQRPLTAADESSLDSDSRNLVSALGASSYASRREASKILRSLKTKEIVRLAKIAAETESAETLVRIMAEIDNRYGSTGIELSELQAASNALEELATDKRTLLAEVATQTLAQHSARRTELAMNELKRLGAEITERSFGPTIAMGGIRRRPVQVILTEVWNGDDDSIKLFKRLAMSGTESPLSISIYLIDGHSISESQRDELRTIYGQNRIVERGRVALGIMGDPIFAPGVIIDNVTRNGSADRAGLQQGDLILAVEGPPKNPESRPDEDDLKIPGDDEFGKDRNPLSDFADLVSQLRAYRPGDTIKLRVIKQFRPPFRIGRIPAERRLTANVQQVDVTLQNWNTPVVKPN